MDFWNWGGFFRSVKGHVIKWWRQTILPVFRLNNNTPQNTSQKHLNNTEQNASQEMQEHVRNIDEQKGKESNMHSRDAGDILKRLENEKREAEERKRMEIESVRQKRQEEERIAAILNANKVDVNAFIAEGKANPESQPDEQELKKQEDLLRAQEILDRLNREAAEDEAKKQAEIEAAKKKAGL